MLYRLVRLLVCQSAGPSVRESMGKSVHRSVCRNSTWFGSCLPRLVRMPRRAPQDRYYIISYYILFNYIILYSIWP